MTAPGGTTCQKCGTPVNMGARYCMSCGADISGAQGEVATQHVAAVGTSQRGKLSLIDALRQATLGDYEVLAELGAGGMATVFLAHDIHLDRKVAIKVMSPQLVAGGDMVERFKLEARTAAGLSHPHVIPIYAVKQEGDLLFFVMKFIEGRALDDIIKKEAPLPVPMVRQILAKVAEALGYAHRKGVVHRDIKPANIMIDTEGQPIVTDFGIAKVADARGLTMTGATIGTPTYMSPEQCNAQPITGASDQYSLGVMAYEMVIGRPLFDGESVMTIMFKHVHEEAPRLHDLADQCPPELADVVMRMLAKQVDDRFEAMEDVVKAVRAPTMSFDDPMRTKLIQYAMDGENRTVLQRISTPRSPIPVATGHATHVATSGRAPGTTTRPSQEPTEILQTAERKQGRRGLIAAVAALLVLGGGGALAVLQPWNGGGTDTAAVPATTTARAAAATHPDDAGAGAAAAGPGDAPATDAAPPANPVTQPADNPPAGPAPVAQIRILNVPGGMGIGDRVQLAAELRDGQGRSLQGRAVQWSSSDAGVVRVTNGEAEAVRAGTATLTALAEGVRTTATVTVTPEGVASVAVSPRTLALEAGQTAMLMARITGDRGSVLQRPVEWRSSDAAVAAVSADGEVSAQGPGTATVSAGSNGQTATVAVTVTPRPLTEAELRAQVTDVIQRYGAALEAKNVDLVRQLYPGMPSQREAQLRQALPNMDDLAVTLNVGQVTFTGSGEATAVVTGLWRFRAGGQGQEIPANNTYRLQRSGDRWVITEIR